MRCQRICRATALLAVISVTIYLELARSPVDYSYLADMPMNELVLTTGNVSTLFILSLNYRLHKFFQPLNVPRIPTKYVTRSEVIHKRLLTFSDLSKIENHEWVRPPYRPEVYRLFPLAIDASKIVHQITQGRAISHRPINWDSMGYLKLPSRVCSKNGSNEFDPLKVVVIIKSAPQNYEKRQSYRRTYSILKRDPFKKYGIAIVFSVGLPRSTASREFKISRNESVLLPGANGAALTANTLNSTRVKFAREMAEHDDMIVGAYEDTYYNLTLKLMHSYYWFSYFCHKTQPTMISMDDDVGFNATFIDQFLSSMQNSTRNNFYGGMLNFLMPVLRPAKSYANQKWGQTKEEEPWQYYANYTSGSFGIVGYAVARAVAITMSFTRFSRIDDAWVGLVLAKLDLPIYHIRNGWPHLPQKRKFEDVAFADFKHFANYYHSIFNVKAN